MMDNIWHRNKHILLFILSIIFIIYFCFIGGCGVDTERKTFQDDIVEHLPENFQYFVIEAVENFLSKNSERYDKTLLDVIGTESPDLAAKYRMILNIWEQYQCSSEADVYNQLVKRILELKRCQAKQDEILEKIFDESIKEHRTALTPDIDKKINRIAKEKYELGLQLINRKKYDNYWYRIESIKDGGSKLLSYAVLELYFNGLPTIEVFFFNDPENGNWLSFYSRIKFYEYFSLKKTK